MIAQNLENTLLEGEAYLNNLVNNLSNQDLDIIYKRNKTYFSKLLRIEQDITCLSSVNEINKTLKDLQKGGPFDFINIGQLTDFSQNVWIPLGVNYFNYKLEFSPVDHADSDLLGLALIRLKNKIDQHLAWLDEIMHLEEQTKMWQNVFSSIPFPSLLCTQRGEITSVSKEFLKLNLKISEIINFNHGHKFIHQGKSFVISKEEFELNNESYYMINFLSIQSDQDKMGPPQELGIMASSIAHELNNPLAGILATIDLLRFTHQEDDVLATLEEMKSSAKRCKNLVQTFLGFSKAHTCWNDACDIENIFTQAMELIRGRTIESNINFDIKFIKSSTLTCYEKNFSILTMVFYIIFSEIITWYSHLQLVKNESESSGIKAKFTESKTNLVLDFIVPEDLEQLNFENNLLAHLLEMTTLQIKKRNNQVILTTIH